MGYLDGSFDGSNDVKLEGLLLGDSLVYNDGKVLGYYEGIKLGFTDGKLLVTMLGNVDKIKLWIDVGTELRSLDGSFDGSNYGKREGLLLVNHWDILMVKCLSLMKASKWDLLMLN